MSNGANIQIDKASLNNLNKQFANLGTSVKDASPKAIFKVLMKIKTEAQLRLKGRGHIVTSRLRNSLYVQMKNQKPTPTNKLQYSNKDGKSYSSELSTVKLDNDSEGAVGTNVIYSNKIETLDSYLYWALKNVDITKSVASDMKNDLKFKQ